MSANLKAHQTLPDGPSVGLDGRVDSNVQEPPLSAAPSSAPATAGLTTSPPSPALPNAPSPSPPNASLLQEPHGRAGQGTRDGRAELERQHPRLHPADWQTSRPGQSHPPLWDHAAGNIHTPTLQIDHHTAPEDEIDHRYHAIETDLVGTPLRLVDESGGQAWASNKTTWGVRLEPTAPDTDCPLRFPGQYHDRETGLNYNTHRYYDHHNGRYCSPDPLGLRPADNHHSYINNPFSGSDPLGLGPCTIHNPNGPPAEKVINLPEVTAPKPLKPSQVDKAWSDFLGPGPYTNIHPRTGQIDPNRLVSSDGRRSIRMGDYEMNSKPTKFHYHMETWDWNSVTNTWTVSNTIQRVPLGIK